MKILKAITILALVALLVACSMKKPDTDNMVSDVKVTFVDNADGTVTYTTTFVVDMTNVPSALNVESGVPKEVEFVSTITFDSAKKNVFEAKPAYKFQVNAGILGGGLMPEQQLGGMTYYEYCKKQVTKETVTGILEGLVVMKGLNGNNLKIGVRSGNEWLNIATTGSGSLTAFGAKKPTADDIKAFKDDRGVKFDKVDYRVISWARPPTNS